VGTAPAGFSGCWGQQPPAEIKQWVPHLLVSAAAWGQQPAAEIKQWVPHLLVSAAAGASSQPLKSSSGYRTCWFQRLLGPAASR